MIGLRAAAGLLGAVVVAASLTVPRPGVLAILTVSGLLLFVVAAGSTAADALPSYPLGVVCSAATMLVGLLLAAQLLPAPVLGSVAVVLQVLAARASPRRSW